MPVRPEEVGARKRDIIPAAVFAAFDHLIIRGFTDGESTVYQDDVIELIIFKSLGGSVDEDGKLRAQMFKENWLDVEETYRQAGWKVEYEKPGYNEEGRAFFKFTRGRSRGRK